MHRRMIQAAAVMMMGVLMITGCTSQASNIGMAKGKENRVVDTGFSVSSVGSYDSADTAVVISTDQQNNSVILANMDTGRQYTLYYDGTTFIKDKYGSSMTISQIKAGDVVDVNFLKGKRKIASMQLSPDAWVYENVNNYDLEGVNKTASIGSSTYSLPEEVVVLSEGRRAEIMDIVAQDMVSVRGIDHKIYSINVERGHGYLRLRNDQALIGGWIEVGNEVIREITEDMLLIVPEGSYQVFLSNNGASCVKDIVVERDREIVLDVGDLKVPENRTGKILISVTPENARVEIDGKSVDISKAVELSYGIHRIHLEAKGYDSLTKYIQVGSEYAKISFTLEEEREEETPSISQNSIDDDWPEQEPEPEIQETPVKEIEEIRPSVSENTISASKTNKVYIDEPRKVEVYVDGNYMGLSPVSFTKKKGKHTVVLRKSGYKTKSYTIYLEDDGKDISYSFSELEKEQSVSGNGTSGGTSSSSSSTTTSSSTSTTTSNPTETPPGGNPGDGTPGGDNSGDGGTDGDNSGDGTTDGDNSGDGGTDGDNSGDGTTDGDNSGDGTTDGDNSGDGTTDGDNSGDGTTDGDNSGDGTTDGDNSGDGTTGGDNSGDGTTDGDNSGDGTMDGNGTGGDDTSTDDNSGQQNEGNSSDEGKIRKNFLTSWNKLLLK